MKAKRKGEGSRIIGLFVVLQIFIVFSDFTEYSETYCAV